MGAPIATILADLTEIHEKMPKSKRIWRSSGKADGRNAILREDMKLRDELLAAIASGQLREEELRNMMYRPGSEPQEA